MYPIIICVCAALLVFCLISAAAGRAGRRRLEVENRILELRAEKEDTKKKVLRPKKKSGKKSAAAMERTRKELEKLENQLYDAGLKIPVGKFLFVWGLMAFILPSVMAIFGIAPFICCSAAAVCAFGPLFYIKIRRKKRSKLLEDQLVEAISILCNALRAGHSFQQAMNNISQEMTGPVSEEFGRVFRETQHGMTMADSMEYMVERTGSDDLEMLCTAILIQREVGGNLAEVLENISGTIQARLSLKAEIKTRTASGRLSGYIVGALPIILLVAMNVINPEYGSLLFNTDAGHIMLIVGGIMEVIGFIVIQKVVTIKY